MDGFEINKVIAAIILTVLVVVGINKLTDKIFFIEKSQESAYKIEISETATIVKTASSETGAVESVDIASLLSQGNVTHGEKVFKKCAACHSISKGGGNKIGPALWNVLGRQTGSLPDYKYSKAMAAHGKPWSFEEMNGFLTKPKNWIKGTKMSFIGLKSGKERAAVILYMNKNSDNPLPLQ